MSRALTIAKADCIELIKEGNIGIIASMNNGFVKPETEDNKSIAEAHNLFLMFVRHELVSARSSHLKKLFDASKANLDEAIQAMGKSSEGVPGTTTLLYEDANFRFSKKQNNDSESVSLTQFKVELAKLGVDETVVAKAAKNATKSKRGNVYYIVEGI